MSEVGGTRTPPACLQGLLVFQYCEAKRLESTEPFLACVVEVLIAFADKQAGEGKSSDEH